MNSKIKKINYSKTIIKNIINFIIVIFLKSIDHILKIVNSIITLINRNLKNTLINRNGIKRIDLNY